jgi:hypothetical protein
MQMRVLGLAALLLIGACRTHLGGEGREGIGPPVLLPDAAAPAPAPGLPIPPGPGAGVPTGGTAVDAAPTAPDPAAGCPRPPACDAPPPDLGPRQPWRNGGSALLASGGARHRGRDQLLPPGAPQWLIGRFAYGLFDSPLTGEDVDVYLLRGCGTAWEKLGTARTTRSGEHPAVEGVEDDGGRVFWEIPAGQALGPGRHRALFVVGGDRTTAELFVEVLPAEAPFFVSDVDGTLTTSETAEFTTLLTGALPEANAGAATLLGILAEKGYRPLYLTARPEWLVERTREFLAKEKFPAGLLRTTLAFAGATGAPAVMYKTAELARLAGRGHRPAFVVGNTDTDAEAYDNAAVEPRDHRLYYRFTDARGMGRRFESYADLLAEFRALPSRCP